MRCPAKLNLYLRVVGRRADGYHELETVFQTIDLCDELAVRGVSGRVRLRCNSAEAPSDHSNLVVRAASLLRARPEAFVSHGAVLTLSKAIPTGAGLGGGSSDAAAALVLLNRLWELGLTVDSLRWLAAELGSDVPFFLEGGAAIGRGRGEVLEPLPDAPTRWFVLAKPPAGVATPWAYAHYRPVGRNGVGLTDFLAAWQSDEPAAIAAGLRNDLEPGVLAERPDIAALLEALLAAGAVNARMTGSGACVFGVCESEAQARSVAERLKASTDAWVAVARSLGAAECQALAAEGA